jgi:hypothetical protein
MSVSESTTFAGSRRPLARIGRGVEVAWSVALVATIALLAVISTTLAAPIMGSDEYAYFIAGRYADRLPELYALEPIQQLSNFAFFSLLHGLFAVAGPGFVGLLRLVHLVEWLLIAYFLYRLIAWEDAGSRGAARKGAAIVLLLPNLMYLFYVMPEADLVFLTVCIGYVTLVLGSRRLFGGAFVAALLTGVALLVKPHAVATAATVAAYLVASPFIDRSSTRLRTALPAVALYVGVSFVTTVVLWRFYTGVWQFNALVLLGFNFYGQFIQTNVPGASLHKVIAVIGYFAAHLAVVSLAFGASIVFMVREIVIAVRRPVAAEHRSARFAVFALLLLFAHVAMTAWFTASAAQLRPASEALRLHGRYLTPALVFIAVVFARALERLDGRALRFAGVYTLGALLVCTLWVLPRFNIYPWDYPLFFAFFSPDNHYGFDFARNLGFLAMPMTIVVGLLVALACIFLRSARACLVALTLAILVVGNLQTYRWVYERSTGLQPLVEQVRSIAGLAGPAQFGKGLLITDDGYAEWPTVLFNLGGAPRLLFKPSGSAVSADELKGADWVLMAGNMTFDFHQQMALSGPFTFLPGTSGLVVQTGSSLPLQVGRTLDVALKNDQYPTGWIEGFHPAEPWGRWMAVTRATVRLPEPVRGQIRIRVWAWTLPENQASPLVIRIGTNSTTIALPNSPAEEIVTLNVDHASDRIEFESLVHRPATETRTLGMALASISIEAL